MAIAFAGVNPNYLSTTTAPPSSTLSFSCFVMVNEQAIGHKNNVIAITDTVNDDGGQSHSLYIYEDTTTTCHFVYSNPNGNIIANFPNGSMPLADGSWFFVAFAVNGTNTTVYWKYAGGPGFNTVSASGTDVAFTPAYIAIGTDATGQQEMNGSICGVRIWRGVLTAADFEMESQCIAPYRTADLWADWRMDSNIDLRDRVMSNLLTASGATNLSQGSGPPIPEYRV